MVKTHPSQSDVLHIVVVKFRSSAVLSRCIDSLVHRSDIATRVVVVDNDPSDQVVGGLVGNDSSLVVVDPGRNVGFAAGANLGLAMADGEWLALINPDTVVPPGVLGALVDVLRARPTVAGVAPRLEWPSGSPQPYSYGGEPTPWYLLRRLAARLFGVALHDWGSGKPGPVDWVSGACILMRRSVLDHVGTLDERFFLYFEDVDWCRRCREAGWQIWFVPGVAVLHDSLSDFRDHIRRRYYRMSLVAYYQKYYGPILTFAMRLIIRSGILG